MTCECAPAAGEGEASPEGWALGTQGGADLRFPQVHDHARVLARRALAEAHLQAAGGGPGPRAHRDVHRRECGSAPPRPARAPVRSRCRADRSPPAARRSTWTCRCPSSSTRRAARTPPAPAPRGTTPCSLTTCCPRPHLAAEARGREGPRPAGRAPINVRTDPSPPCCRWRAMITGSRRPGPKTWNGWTDGRMDRQHHVCVCACVWACVHARMCALGSLGCSPCCAVTSWPPGLAAPGTKRRM